MIMQETLLKKEKILVMQNVFKGIFHEGHRKSGFSVNSVTNYSINTHFYATATDSI